MLTSPRVSACMVLYHSGPVALEAAQSLKDSTLNVEFFVVDNSPDDPTASSIQRRCPGVRIMRMKKNLGFGRANNEVLPHLTSQYHLLLNPDVTFEPDLLERMVAYMEEHRDIAILTPRVFNTDGTEQYLPKYTPTIHYLLGGKLQSKGKIFEQWRREFTMQDEEITQPIEVGFATGCFLLIRTQFFRELKGFDPRFFLYQEDSDLTLRAARLGKVVFHPDMHVTHVWKRENTRTHKGTRAHIISTIKFFTKWGWKW